MKIVSTILVYAHALLLKVSALHNIICSIVSISAALSRSTLTLYLFSSRRQLLIDPCTCIKVLVLGYNHALIFIILNNFIFSSAVSRIFVKTNGNSK